MTGQDFERDMVHAFNNYVEHSNIDLIAYRHYQMRFQSQLFDVLVDSYDRNFYFALECKSINPYTVPNLYFKKAFSWQKGVCQVVRETHWLNLSGRRGYLVVELRRPRPSKTACYFVPWVQVEDSFYNDLPCVYSDVILSCPSIEKAQGKYTIDEDFVAELIKGADN